MTATAINGRWTLDLPDHRAARPEWPWWEAVRLDSMHQHLKPDDLLFDVGAEEGDLSALFASWGARVVCVEPNPKVWPNIRACFDANGLTPAGWWVGFAGAQLDVAETPNDWRWSDQDRPWPSCAYGPITTDHGFLQLNERSDADVTTIDQLAETFGPPDAVTMDVEGAELEVLRGANETLTVHRPKLWISVHPTFMADLYSTPVRDLWALLDGHGYRRVLLDYDHELHVLALPR